MNMKKKTIYEIEFRLTKIFKDNAPEITAEEAKQIFADVLHTDCYDNAHINVQVFEVEKAERISTEDLIKQARLCFEHCIEGWNEEDACSKCMYTEFHRSSGAKFCVNQLDLAVLNRLEELHNQQTATPATQPEEQLAKIKKRPLARGGFAEICSHCEAELPFMDCGGEILHDENIGFCYHCGKKFEGRDEE